MSALPAKYIMEAAAATRNAKNKSKRRIFFTTKSPTIKAVGNMTELPIHHEAPDRPKRKTAPAPNAAGLKICFLIGAKRYFEAIAITPAKISAHAIVRFSGGGIIKKSMNAVMYTDSTFTDTRSIFAKIKFET